MSIIERDRKTADMVPGESSSRTIEFPVKSGTRKGTRPIGSTGEGAIGTEAVSPVTTIFPQERIKVEEAGSSSGEVPEIAVDLGELGEHRLLLDSNAMELIEEKTGGRFLDTFKPQSAKDVLAFFWGCLQYEDDPPTMEEIGAAVYVYQMGEIFDIMARLSGRCKNSSHVLAPFLPANPVVVDEIFKYMEPEFGSILWDLGSGDGRVLAKALKDHGMQGVGIEWEKNLVQNSRELIEALDAKEKIEIREGRIQDHIRNDPDFPEADIVFIYLLTHSNVKLAETLQRRLKKGARVVAYSFPFRGWEDLCEEAVEGHCEKVDYYIYTLKGNEDVSDN